MFTDSPGCRTEHQNISMTDRLAYSVGGLRSHIAPPPAGGGATKLAAFPHPLLAVDSLSERCRTRAESGDSFDCSPLLRLEVVLHPEHSNRREEPEFWVSTPQKLALLRDWVSHPPADVVHQELAIGSVHHKVQRVSDLWDGSTVQGALICHSIHRSGDCQFMVV